MLPGQEVLEDQEVVAVETAVVVDADAEDPEEKGVVMEVSAEEDMVTGEEALEERGVAEDTVAVEVEIGREAMEEVQTATDAEVDNVEVVVDMVVVDTDVEVEAEAVVAMKEEEEVTEDLIARASRQPPIKGIQDVLLTGSKVTKSSSNFSLVGVDPHWWYVVCGRW